VFAVQLLHWDFKSFCSCVNIIKIEVSFCDILLTETKKHFNYPLSISEKINFFLSIKSYIYLIRMFCSSYCRVELPTSSGRRPVFDSLVSHTKELKIGIHSFPDWSSSAGRQQAGIGRGTYRRITPPLSDWTASSFDSFTWRQKRVISLFFVQSNSANNWGNLSFCFIVLVSLCVAYAMPPPLRSNYDFPDDDLKFMVGKCTAKDYFKKEQRCARNFFLSIRANSGRISKCRCE